MADLADLKTKARELAALLKSVRRAAKGKGAPADYAAHAESMAEKSREKSQRGRDIGPTPDIANPRRRERCRLSLSNFCRVYNPQTFRLPFGQDHLAVIESIEQSVMTGAMLAFAMPRGSGKTSICRMAVLWASFYAHSPYTFLIAATEPKAVESLEAIKLWTRDLPLLVADFPEVSTGARKLAGIANRSIGQHQAGKATMIHWERDRIVLPCVTAPGNLRGFAGKPAPTSGVVIGVSGLTGEGIRGSLFGHPDGRQIRPRFVLLDDPQTDESAASPTQNASRLRLIQGAVLGMVGPGEELAAVMPCTVIRPGDMVDRLLDRKENPLWRGRRTAMLTGMPASLEEWEKYLEVYREYMGRDRPDPKPVNRYYRTNRATLEKGVVLSWPARKTKGDVSATQTAINLYCKVKRVAFFAEYQNAPLLDEELQRGSLTREIILGKLNGLDRGVIPQRAERLTAFVDVHDELLYWLVTAWAPGLTGAVIDYGAWPPQRDRHFYLANARPMLSQQYPGRSKDGIIFAGLDALLHRLLIETAYRRQDGATMPIELCMIDTGYKPEIVAAVIRSLARGPQLQASRGQGIGCTKKPFAEYNPEPGVRKGWHWRKGITKATQALTVTIDVNWWKSFCRDRLASAKGDPGSLEIYGRRPEDHSLLAEHLSGEHPTEGSGPWGRVEDWQPRPNTDVHWWDCLVGCATAASVLGMTTPEWAGAQRQRRNPADRPSLAELGGIHR